MLESKSIDLLLKSLDAATLRQQVIANNIANINTPGFKRSFVTFEENLKLALDRQQAGLPLAVTNKDHFGSFKRPEDVKPAVEQETDTSLRQDGNNVDLDTEMAQMAMNAVNYDTAVEQLNARLKMLKLVITGGS